MDKNTLFYALEVIKKIKTACPPLAFSIMTLKWGAANNDGSIARAGLNFQFNDGYANHQWHVFYLFHENGTCTFNVQKRPPAESIYNPLIQELIAGEHLTDQATHPHTWRDGLAGMLELIDDYRQTIVKICRSLDGPLNDAYQQLNN